MMSDDALPMPFSPQFIPNLMKFNALACSVPAVILKKKKSTKQPLVNTCASKDGISCTVRLMLWDKDTFIGPLVLDLPPDIIIFWDPFSF